MRYTHLLAALVAAIFLFVQTTVWAADNITPTLAVATTPVSEETANLWITEVCKNVCTFWTMPDLYMNASVDEETDRITVTMPLVQYCQSEAELEAIVLHEKGHIVLGQTTKARKKQYEYDTNYRLHPTEDNLKSLTIIAGVSALFSKPKTADLAADMWAYDQLKARYPDIPSPMMTLAKRMEDDPDFKSLLPYLASHPLYKERLKMVARIGRMGAYQSIQKQATTVAPEPFIKMIDGAISLTGLSQIAIDEGAGLYLLYASSTPSMATKGIFDLTVSAGSPLFLLIKNASAKDQIFTFDDCTVTISSKAFGPIVLRVSAGDAAACTSIGYKLQVGEGKGKSVKGKFGLKLIDATGTIPLPEETTKQIVTGEAPKVVIPKK